MGDTNNSQDRKLDITIFKDIALTLDKILLAIIIAGILSFSMFTFIKVCGVSGVLGSIAFIRLLLTVFVLEIIMFLFYGFLKLIKITNEKQKERIQNNRKELFDLIKKEIKNARTNSRR